MRNLRAEDEIIANWEGDIDKPLVSICCITYNQQSYIEDALQGFLIQKTRFPFEILIHDDASTDHTADIIREYGVRYPRLIKPIFQTENHYSKGFKMNPTFNFRRAKGKFIAICEGDDYWIATEKLQTQVELMGKYPAIKISFHPAYKVDKHEIIKNEIFSNYGRDLKIFRPEEVILGDGDFMPTASILVDADVVKELPLWFYKEAPVSDYYIQVIASIEKGSLYIPSVMSGYRVNITGSWSDTHKKNFENIKKFILAQCKTFNEMNNHYSRIYEVQLKSVLVRQLISVMANSNFGIAEKKVMINDCRLFLPFYKVIWLTCVASTPSFIIAFFRLIYRIRFLRRVIGWR